MVAVLVGVAVLVDRRCRRGGIGSRRDGSVRRIGLYSCSSACASCVGRGRTRMVVVCSLAWAVYLSGWRCSSAAQAIFVTTGCVGPAWGGAADDAWNVSDPPALRQRYRLKAVVYARSRV